PPHSRRPLPLGTQTPHRPHHPRRRLWRPRHLWHEHPPAHHAPSVSHLHPLRIGTGRCHHHPKIRRNLFPAPRGASRRHSRRTRRLRFPRTNHQHSGGVLSSRHCRRTLPHRHQSQSRLRAPRLFCQTRTLSPQRGHQRRRHQRLARQYAQPKTRRRAFHSRHARRGQAQNRWHPHLPSVTRQRTRLSHAHASPKHSQPTQSHQPHRNQSQHPGPHVARRHQIRHSSAGRQRLSARRSLQQFPNLC